jgi:hypothetical protein
MGMKILEKIFDAVDPVRLDSAIQVVNGVPQLGDVSVYFKANRVLKPAVCDQG